MSTIQSSAEHLTLNADGSSKDIKLQSNASEKVIVKSDGKVGIGTSSPAQKLHIEDTTASNTSTYVSVVSGTGGNAGITFGDSDADLVGGVLYNNTDNALRFFKSGFSEAMRINSSGAVGIGRDPAALLHLESSEPEIRFTYTGNSGYAHVKSNNNAELIFSAGTTTGTERMRITSDGRGLSQFTAKAWCNWNGSGTVAIRDSHNCSSIADHGTGLYVFNFGTNVGNANYSATSMAKDSRIVSFGDAVSVPSASSFQVRCQQSWDASQTDNDRICVTVFGD